MCDEEDLDEHKIDIGGHPACADEPPAIKYSCIEESSGLAEVPSSTWSYAYSYARGFCVEYVEYDVDVEGLTPETTRAEQDNDIIDTEQAYDN